MAEPLDELVDRCTNAIDTFVREGGGTYDEIQAIVETAIKDVWNARGAADVHAVEEKLATLTGWVSSEPYRQHLREAIETLNQP